METQTPILIAQCKAFHSIEDVSQEIESLLKIHPAKSLNINISLPYSFIDPILNKFSAHEFKVGAEIMLDTSEKSFTGSIAGKLLEEKKVGFVLIGTSQDRLSHSENPHELKNNIKTALANKIQPYICIGETLQEHQDKASKEILLEQLKDCIDGLSSEELKNIYIIYNAEWISRTPWEATSPELNKAYKTFKEVVNEAAEPGSISHNQLIVAIPAYSEDVALLVNSLQAESNPFVGYSVGILGSSAEYLIPIMEHPAEPANESKAETEELPQPEQTPEINEHSESEQTPDQL